MYIYGVVPKGWIGVFSATRRSGMKAITEA